MEDKSIRGANEFVFVIITMEKIDTEEIKIDMLNKNVQMRLSKN